MPNPRLAERYAKSVVDLAVETDRLEAVFQDMILMNDSCGTNPDLVRFLKSPVINAEKKEKIFVAIFGDRISEISRKFAILLIKKGREGYLPEIARAAIHQYRILKNIRQVKMITAVPLSDELKADIIKKIKAEITNQQIELITDVKEDLIGGFILETNNTIFDASIARDLKDIKKQFNKNIYISDL